MKRPLTWILLTALAVALLVVWPSRAARKLSGFGFPSLPSGSVVEKVYSLGGFSTVYMVRVSFPSGARESYASTFPWSREIIGIGEGRTRVFTSEEFDAFMKTGDISTKVALRENYPEAFSWWTPQVITQGVLFKKEEDGVIRRAYIDFDRSVAYLFYQRS